MATMATSHNLSVMTNSCIKPPVDPQTGLSSTMHERPKPSMSYLFDELSNGYVYEHDQHQFYENGSPDLVTTKPALKTIARDLSNCTDEEFYEKLTQIKNEHKKTLVLCEKLYKEKINHQNQPEISGIGPRPVTITSTLNGLDSSAAQNLDVPARDYIKGQETILDRSANSKPPLPFSKTQRISRSPSDIPVCRPSSAPVHRRGSLTKSLEEEVWKSISERREKQTFDNFEDEQHLQNRSYGENENPELSGALSQIGDMWEEFSIEDYYPRSRQRPSSATVTKGEKEEKEWRHRITIPKPFKMTIREENKEKTVSKAQMELEEQRKQQEAEERIECSKKFKAAPVPAHVYLPLFDEIMEQQEAKRRFLQQHSQELLKSQEKPFKFHYRERSKERQTRIQSAPTQRESKTKHMFKANPVPDYLYDNTVYDRILEEEEYRKIRMKMRSEELLKNSSLPSNMAALQKAKELKAKEKAIKRKKKHYSKTKVNHEVPDYDELYLHFQKELARRKNERDGTVVKPFHLHTENMRSSREKIISDIANDERTLKENRWPYKNPRTTPQRSLGHLSTSLDSIPAKMTNAAALRSSQSKKKLSTMTEKERREIDEERRKRNKEMKYRRLINERTSTENLSETTEQRLRRYREAERERMEQYEKELQNMKDRIDQRPLLFEQESQVNAKKSAEKKFTAKLRSHGVDEEALQTRSSRTVSVHDSYDSYDDDFDDTYMKTKEVEVES
ncbi:FAM161A [Mytilus coruscus]|uniref:FAM161A n=1 Tax=Mytilus coruscus TaxID=42192 RepID=A0A6J8ENV6_MYTCO|nr:FAM161A [Mytilus coruscus]